MKLFLSMAALASTLFVQSAVIHAEPARPESIKALMQLSGSGQMGMQMMQQLLPALKRMVPDAPESFWSDVLDEVDADEMENRVIPIYQKYLNEADVQAINRFYQTDAGQKLIRVQPQIMQESVALGQQWGQEIARQVLLKYQQQSKANNP
ncbi:DUF2059 domain-containing protein [Agarivorans gilvus]|uniref:DUF2059 domain-containing protein n=1 Tax=Agarivorans gilvus TaxID=680279 RepID=A0ABQ1I5H5_9ALTE|nr:DUF2059 domain-containing protein [Agarivorans gilvus]GGB14213.1 hypothetical protein GCM10007414_29540 [Agarivorans gilvus]